MKVSVLTATYKRPEMLEQCLKNGKAKAGMTDFEWLVHDNAPKNIGLNAYAKLAGQAKGEYFITVDEDVIDFSDNWMKTLVEAVEDAPFPWKIWGWLGSDTIKDDKTNGALWPDWINGTRILQSPKGFKFIVDKRVPQTCTITHREIYRRAGGFKTSKQLFFQLDADYARKMDKWKMPQGICLDVKVYHACGPYFYKDYPELWEEKQGETLKQGIKTYLKRDPSLTALKELL